MSAIETTTAVGAVTRVEMRECGDCGLLQSMPVLESGSVAHCARCDAVLRRAARQAEGFALLCASLALVLYLAALTIPFMSVHAAGRHAHATLFAGPEWLERRGLWPLAILVFVTLVAVPMLRLSGLVAVLVAARRSVPPRWLGRIFRYTKELAPWSMIEVFLLGAFVAYTRLGQLAHVAIEPALYLLCGVMLCNVTAQATLDEEAIWDLAEGGRSDDATASQPHVMCHGCGRLERSRAGERCFRCGAVLHVRLPRSLQRTWALVIAALLLYIPANVLPVMTVRKLGHGEPNTIISGVTELFHARLVPLAILVFVASFVFPAAKILGLVTMLVATRLRSAWFLRGRTKLFRVIDAIGRWSMLDVFVLSTLVGLVHMGFTGSVLPGWGAVAFGGVVVLTMAAAETFDPRVMWDAGASTPNGGPS